MKLTKHKAIFIIAALSPFILLAAGCTGPTETVKDIPSVKVMKLEKKSMTVSVEYPARLLPFMDIDVSAKIPGRVSEVYFNVGSEVRKGDILFTLEAEDSKSQLRQSEAALASTKENTRQQLLQAQTVLEQAQLQYDNIKSNYEKINALYEQGAASRQQRDDVENLYRNAATSLDAAKKNLEILNGTGSGGLADAQVDQAQSAVEGAAVQVENSIIRSPIDGAVSACNVKAGELTSSALVAYTIINSDALSAEINVPGEVKSALSVGQTLRFKIGVSGEIEADGTIDTISPAADSRTGFHSVKAILKNSHRAIDPGMFAKAVIPIVNKTDIFTVRGGAIISENGIEYVYVVQDGTVVKKIIKTGASSETETEISGDLKAGDSIILEGQSFLNEGEEVKVSADGGIS